VQYLWTRSKGLSRARNIGLDAARYEICVFTDDDIYVAVDWLHALTDALVRAGHDAVVNGRVLPGDGTGFIPTLAVDDVASVLEGRPDCHERLIGGNMAMRRQVAGDVGRFDERLGAGGPFPAAEDNDYGFRLLDAGYRIVYVPAAVMYHRGWRSGHEFLRVRWNYGMGQGGFYAKHLSLRDRYMLWCMVRRIGGKARDVFWDLRAGELRRAWAGVLYIAGVLYGAVRWLVTQRDVIPPQPGDHRDVLSR
jgi:glycosyltransferase involved in cell wall biosynthesis